MNSNFLHQNQNEIGTFCQNSDDDKECEGIFKFLVKLILLFNLILVSCKAIRAYTYYYYYSILLYSIL